MRYLALVIAVVLAAAASCPAELAEFTSTLVTPASMDFTVEVTLFDPIGGAAAPVTVSDTASSALTGVQGIRLDCDFDATSHAVTSVNSIVFLLSYGDKIDFTDDPNLSLDFTFPYYGTASITMVASNLGGSLSTGRQSNTITIDPMPVTSGTFPLDRDSDPVGDEGTGDLLFYLNQGMFVINLNYVGNEQEITWWFDPDDPSGEGSEAWNDGNDMPGNGSVSASLSSIASGVATYDVDVTVPIYGIITIPNPDPANLPAPATMGYAYMEATLSFEGQFTRAVTMPLLGDANNDSTVNAADASILGEYWMQSGEGIGWAQGDFNGDHVVNDQDASILAAHFGESAEGTAVPEPSTVVLLLGLVMAGLVAWRRR